MIRAILTSREDPENEILLYISWPADESPPEVIRRDGMSYAIDPSFNALALDEPANAVRYFRCVVLEIT